MSPPSGPLSHAQAHQVGTFSPKPPGYFLIFCLGRWSLLPESIKVLPRNTLQFLCHRQVRAGLRRQLGSLEQQPEEGPYNQPQNIQSKKKKKKKIPCSILRKPQTPEAGTCPELPRRPPPGLCPCSSLDLKVPSLETSPQTPANRGMNPKAASYRKPPWRLPEKSKYVFPYSILPENNLLSSQTGTH